MQSLSLDREQTKLILQVLDLASGHKNSAFHPHNCQQFIPKFNGQNNCGIFGPSNDRTDETIDLVQVEK